MLGSRKTLVAAIAWALVAGAFAVPAPASARQAGNVLYSYVERSPSLVLWDGEFGPVARLQARLKVLLADVDPSLAARVVADGKFNRTTAEAVRRVQQLPAYSEFARDSLGGGATVTAEFWRELFRGDALPTLHERAMTLVLTYEATPFGKPAHWNFCQRPLAGGRRQAPCRTNDDSMITWGPRGATLGGGREIQAVLIETERRDPTLVRDAFGPEYGALRRVLGLATRVSDQQRTTPRSREQVSDTELFTCTIWLDAARAGIWAEALGRVGSHRVTQEVYEAVYKSRDYDGGKMDAFFALYRELGIAPSEVDYAFFLDRSTHTNGVFAQGHRANRPGAIAARASQIRDSLSNTAAPANWQYRLAIARLMPTGAQRDDRNGRDMAFIIDGAGEGGLSATELANWKKRFGLRASMTGLSDAVVVDYSPDQTAFVNQIEGQPLTTEERATCPDWVVQRQKLSH